MAAVSCGGDAVKPTDTGTAGTGTASASAGLSAGASAAAGTGSAGPAATFSAIYEMMFPMKTNARCDACHANPANDVGNGNLQMGTDKVMAYAALVGKTSKSSRCMNKPLVVPSHPEMSLMLQKLSPMPPCGSRMPVGGNPFTAEQLEMIRSWIAAGAKDD